ncbi:hypothetical protein FCV25MIE_08912, partial [Fagus crenata]
MGVQVLSLSGWSSGSLTQRLEFRTLVVHQEGHYGSFNEESTMIDNEPTDRFSDKVAEDKSSKSLLHQTGNSEQTLGHREK